MQTETKVRRALLTPKEAAVYLGERENFLAKMRCSGDGPAYFKRLGRVKYDPADLDAWLAAGKRHSTSETTEAA